MQTIKNMMYEISIISIVAGIYSLFATTAKKQKYLNFIISLIVIIVLLSPFKKLYDQINFDKIFNYNATETIPQNLQTNFNKPIETAISKNLSNQFSIPNSTLKVYININTENNEIIVNNINVEILDEEYFRYAESIEKHLFKSFGCEIKVTQKFEEQK